MRTQGRVWKLVWQYAMKVENNHDEFGGRLDFGTREISREEEKG